MRSSEAKYSVNCKTRGGSGGLRWVAGQQGEEGEAHMSKQNSSQHKNSAAKLLKGESGEGEGRGQELK